jgi:hypothetical protein
MFEIAAAFSPLAEALLPWVPGMHPLAGPH